MRINGHNWPTGLNSLSVEYNTQIPKETTQKHTEPFLIIDYILGQKYKSLQKENIEITLYNIIYDHKAIKSKVDNKQISKYTNSRRLSNLLLNDEWLKKEIKK